MANARETRQMAEEERRYNRSAQAALDLEIDKVNRARADMKAGHVPQCSLTRCADNCPSLNR